MRVLIIVLLVTMGCSLVYPAPNMGKAERKFGFAKSFQSKFDFSHLKITNDPQKRFARNSNLAIDAKEYEKWNGNFQCCQRAEDARLSKRETKVDETSQDKPVIANNDANNELLSEDKKYTNEPPEATMTTKAAEDLLTENVSSQFPLTENNEISVTDKSASPDVSNNDQLKYLFKDSEDNVLKTLLSNLVDDSTDNLDNLFKSNLVNDPESDSLFLTKYSNKDAEDDSGLKSLKYSLFNKAAKRFKNKPSKKILRAKQELLGLLLQAGLPALELLLTSKAGNSLDDSRDFEDNQILSALKFPLFDKNGKSITDKDALLQALQNKGLKRIKFPLINKSGEFLKNGKDLLKALATSLQFFFTMNNGEDLDELKFPLLHGAWEIFKNKADLLPGLFKDGFEASNFPLIDAFKAVLGDPQNLLGTLFDKSALSNLQLPKKGGILNNKQDLLVSLLGGITALPKFNLKKDLSTVLEALLDSFQQLNFPLTDNTGGMLKNTSDVLQTLLKCSPDLAAIQFPLADVAGKVLETKQALLATLSNANALNALKFPLSDCAGKVFKCKIDFLRTLLKGVTSLHFPLKDSMGNILADVVSLLDTLLQSCLTLLKPALNPLTDILKSANDLMQHLFSGKHELFETILKGKCQIMPTLYTLLGTPPLSGIKKEVRDLVKPLFDANSLSDLKCPTSKTLETVLEKILPPPSLPTSLTAAVEVSVKTKLDLLLNLFGAKSLDTLIFPLIDNKGNVLKNKLDLIKALVNGGLASLKFPLTDAAGSVLKDKSKLAEFLNEILLPFGENKKAASAR